MLKNKKGFTILELIVVIAIIALFATIVVLRIDNPKNKTADATVKAQMKEIAAQAGIYYIDYGDFEYMCDTASGDSVVLAALDQIKFNSINFQLGGGACVADVQNWAVWATLKGGGRWCMDSFDFMGDREGSSGQCL